MFEIVDRHTGRVVSTYSNRIRASRKVDRLDNEYGAYRYFVRPITFQPLMTHLNAARAASATTAPATLAFN